MAHVPSRAVIAHEMSSKILIDSENSKPHRRVSELPFFAARWKSMLVERDDNQRILGDVYIVEDKCKGFS
jgi:hypothetical protein